WAPADDACDTAARADCGADHTTQHRRRTAMTSPMERRTVLKTGIATAGVLGGVVSTELTTAPASADTAPSPPPDQMQPAIQPADQLTADVILDLLKLEPNATCGFVRQTFVSRQSLAAGVLPSPFGDARPLGSALYFMVTPGAPVRLHRIRNDQLY